MADIDDEMDLSLDDPVVDEDQEELRNILRNMLKGDDPDDQAATDELPPLIEPENVAVSMDEGLDLINKSGKIKPADEPAAPAETAPVDGAAKVDEPASEATVEVAPAVGSDDVEALLTGLDPERAGKIRSRLATASALSDFDGLLTSYKDQLATIAEKPAEAVTNLLKLHDYANKNPDQYLAWAATQLGQDPEDVIIKAAEHLGLKVTRPEDGADPFEDEEVKKLRAENRALKQASGHRLPFGPDVGATAPNPSDPTAILNAFKDEKGADGALLRPLWDDLTPIIASKAAAMREATGNAVTTADLDRIYREEVAKLSAKFAPTVPAVAQVPAGQRTVAAPQVAPVQQDLSKKPAAAAKIDRAKAASNHIDGTGQGADRHSAPPDASIRDVLRFNLERMKRNG